MIFLHIIELHALTLTIVEFYIPVGYPGPSKERGTEVRLMQSRVFHGKI